MTTIMIWKGKQSEDRRGLFEYPKANVDEEERKRLLSYILREWNPALTQAIPLRGTLPT